ncbi:efflux transporter outer membrane subunit [Neptuniibacter halophilus]|uniref:efflux transporter outer membrane subunit n=1 Tax=Neptuniibacter halophilus TaxID=651666 RepID=UPI002573E7C4|nr:efflux transporter outer membrane subunit [Neptuniibacter halophilus]
MDNNSYYLLSGAVAQPGRGRQETPLWRSRLLTTMLLSLMLTGCVTPQTLKVDPVSHMPEQWSRTDNRSSQLSGWLTELNDPQLTQLVAEALQSNPELAAAQARLEQARQALRISDADRYPDLALSLGAERAENADGSLTLNSELSWDPDLWGELGARQRQTQLEFVAATAELRQAEEELAVSVANRWFELQEAQLLLQLYTERSATLESDLAVIESGYRQGLYEALDLFLARNDLNAQNSTVAEQQQTLAESRRALEQLLGRYPQAALITEASLALTEEEQMPLLSSGMLLRRPDLQASWLSLLAADQALAAAHSARYPSFSLSAAYGGSSSALSELVSGGGLAWSLGASLVQTLFDAGRLEATEAQQLAVRQELESSYLNDLYSAFTEVENALDQRATLKQRHALYLAARSNADQAEQLAFERYQRGLETYTTVLEARRRSLDAQTEIISLRRTMLQNRIGLAQALGGSFQPESANTISLAESEASDS